MQESRHRVVYKFAVFDSTRWERFVPRLDDIFICTPPKSGTTWMQAIVASLLWPAGDPPGSVWSLSPWLDANFAPIDEIVELLEAQRHRRFIKTHTPPDGVPRFDACRYVAVFRDGRDAFMSWANHVGHFRDDIRKTLNARAAENGVPPIVEWHGDPHAIFDAWIGMPMPLVHLAQWWPLRLEPNVLLVHFNDLKADLESEMRRVAGFLGVEVPADAWPAVVERCTFAHMKARSGEIARFEELFEGGAEAFLHTGTNGRWPDVLTEAELAAYRAKVVEMVPPDAAAWLEAGSLALGRRP